MPRTLKRGKQKEEAESSSEPPVTPKRARKSIDGTEEKRLARFLKSPSKATMERIERAYQHRLYLIEERMIGSPPTGSEFVVLGATGNVYSVKVEQRPSCTCPDAAKGNTCKHLLFVMLRVLKLSPSDPRAWQTALLTSELQDLLTISATNEGILASQTVRQRFHELSGTKPEAKESGDKSRKKETKEEKSSIQRELSGDCPICYEAMAGEEDGKPREPVVFCKSCGNNVHRDCFEKWSRSKQGTGGKVTCIYCRANWFDHGSTRAKAAADGAYVNLASYSEAHARQDTSLQSLYPETWEWIERGQHHY